MSMGREQESPPLYVYGTEANRFIKSSVFCQVLLDKDQTLFT
ncbi:hypothetical protein LSPH24S_03476 [Lysinibacillus sphaericus]